MKLLAEGIRFTSLGTVIYDDNAPVRVNGAPKAMETLSCILKAVPVEDNYGYKRFRVQRMESLRA